MRPRIQFSPRFRPRPPRRPHPLKPHWEARRAHAQAMVEALLRSPILTYESAAHLRSAHARLIAAQPLQTNAAYFRAFATILLDLAYAFRLREIKSSRRQPETSADPEHPEG